MTVSRDLWASAARCTSPCLPDSPLRPRPILACEFCSTPASAAVLGAGAVTMEVSYRPQAVNTAAALAVSLQGAGPADWVKLPLQPQAGVLRFQLPPAFAPRRDWVARH